MDINKITKDKVIQLYNRLDYPISEGVNICGVRSLNMEADKFDDAIIAFNSKDFIVTPATTDPGLYYRNNPLNLNGTAILPIGFHKDMWTYGKHRNKYGAMVQVDLCRVIRDNDKDDLINYTIPPDAKIIGTDMTYYNYHKQWNEGVHDVDKGIHIFGKHDKKWVIEIGYFGINLHRAHEVYNVDKVGKFSAGCQVVQDSGQYENIMNMIREDGNTPNDSYSYALFTSLMLMSIK